MGSDISDALGRAKKAGATTVALVNAVDSPLARIADFVIPLSAGPETSVAATKSFIASVSALLFLVASWAGDADVLAALKRLPGELH